MKRYFLIFSLLFLFFSCSEYKKTEFEKSIEANYNTSCNKLSSCTVNIASITPYDWDKMYVFKTTASLETIDKALGFNYPYFEDIAERVVFLKNNKIVYHDDYYPTFDDEMYTSIVFDLPNDESFKLFSVKNAIFKIDKKEIEEKQTYFVLSQIEN